MFSIIFYFPERSDYGYYGGYGAPGGPGRSGSGIINSGGIRRVTTPARKSEDSSSVGGPAGPGLQIRKDFPETWIWEELFAS
jgi:hypothetical protein